MLPVAQSPFFCPSAGVLKLNGYNTGIKIGVRHPVWEQLLEEKYHRAPGPQAASLPCRAHAHQTASYCASASRYYFKTAKAAKKAPEFLTKFSICWPVTTKSIRPQCSVLRSDVQCLLLVRAAFSVMQYYSFLKAYGVVNKKKKKSEQRRKHSLSRSP